MITVRKASRLLAVATAIFSFLPPARADGPYTPQQTMTVFYEALRNIINPNLPSNMWLSLSMVGAVAEADDPSIVNDLANFCPEPSPLITSFARVRHLDSIYLSILKDLTGPLRPETPEYVAAKDFLFKNGALTPEFTSYQKLGQDYAAAFSAYLQETDPNKRSLLLQKATAAEQNWMLAGYRGEVDGALFAIEAGETRFGPVKLGQRNRVLQWYKSSGRAPSDVAGAYLAPASDLSPAVSAWNNDTGWVSVSYSSHDVEAHLSQSNSRNNAFGGLSLGFVTLAGSGGGGNGNVSKVSQVNDFAYSFEVKRVLIRRPWLDTEVFFEPRDWTWKKSGNTTDFPHVSGGVDADGVPSKPTSTTYDNAQIDCPMLPLELIIARKRSLVATVSKSDYQQITTGGSSGGGGSLFGIFGGGGSRSWSTTTVNETSNDVTFKVDSPSIAVIGLISEVVPKLPDPNLGDTWPDKAWLEPQQ
ncbi:hypothetical protein NKJ86_13805 [Mesorhizobium sp. M0025]|uniref:hypothetical protein n=1 Tax=Mesorhizobium sp. M0025 TaxID=2956846 RepID=UPI003339CEB0